MATPKTRIIAYTITIDGIDRTVRNLGDVQQAIKDITKERDKLTKKGGLDLTDAADKARFDAINKSLSEMKSNVYDVNKAITDQRKQTSLLNQDLKGTSGSYNELKQQTASLTQLAKQLGSNLPYDEWRKLRAAIGEVIPEVKQFGVAELQSGEALAVVQKQIAANNTTLKEFDRTLSGNVKTAERYQKGLGAFFKEFGGADIAKRKVAELRVEEERLAVEAKNVVTQLKAAQQGTAVYDALEQEARELESQLKRTRDQMDDMNGTMKKSKSGASLLQGVFTGLSTVLAEFGLTSAIDVIKKVISLNVEMDKSLARVAKTTQLTKEEARQLNREFRTLDTGTVEDELRQMAVVAGKLGIEGVDNILAFVQATDRVKVALGDELGQDTEATLERLTKIVNIFGLGQDYPFAEAIERVGSAVNYLSDAGAASASGLVDFTRRLAGVAPIANISVTDILGFGSALEELGQTSEVSGTAMVRLIVKLGQNVPLYAKIAGKSIAEFSELIRTDANEALLTLIEKSRSSKEGVEGLARTLGLLEINGVRVATVFGALSENIDLVRKRQVAVGEAFEKNTYLAKAFALQSDTLGTSFSKLSKTLQSFVLSEGATDTLKGWVTALNNVLSARNKINAQVYKVDTALKQANPAGLQSEQDGSISVNKKADLLFVVNVLDQMTSKVNEINSGEGFNKLFEDLRKYREAIKEGEVVNLQSAEERRAGMILTNQAMKEVILAHKTYNDAIAKTSAEQKKAYDESVKLNQADIAHYEDVAKKEEIAAAKAEKLRKKQAAEDEKALKTAEKGSIEALKTQIKELEAMLDRTTDEKRQVEIILDIVKLKAQLTEAEDALARLRAKEERKPIEVLKLPSMGSFEASTNEILSLLEKKVKSTPIDALQIDDTLVYQTLERGIEGNIKFLEDAINKIRNDIADARLDNPFFNFDSAKLEIKKLQDDLSILKLLSPDLLQLEPAELDRLEGDIVSKIQEIKGKIGEVDSSQTLFSAFDLSKSTGVSGLITQLGLLQAASSETKDNLIADLTQLLEKLEELRLTNIEIGFDNAAKSFGSMSAAMGSLSESFKEGSKEAEVFARISKKLASIQNILAQSLLIAGIAREASKGVFGVPQMFALIAAFASAIASASSIFRYGEGGDLDSPDGHLLPSRGRGIVKGNKSHASGDDIAVNYKGRNIRIESGEALVDVIGADGTPKKFVLSKRTMQDPVLRSILESVNYRIANARNSTFGNINPNVFATGGEIRANVSQSGGGNYSSGVTVENIQAIIDAQLDKLLIVNNVVDADKVLTYARKNATLFEG